MWTPQNMPTQEGKTAIVTGANSGIGFYAAAHLAAHGAHVVLACRSTEKAQQARERIISQSPHATVTVVELDLANLTSVERFSRDIAAEFKTIDLLINNAGVMIPPYQKTAQGFELQFGTNHLGHFALTGHLLPILLNTPHSRVVTVASNAHRFGWIDFNDPNHEQRYIPWEAYGQSKLANLLFAFELDRRLKPHTETVLSTAAHPGFASTQITRESWWMVPLTPIFGQSSDVGSWATLRAATDPGATGGSYWGPRWLFQMWGAPKKVGSTRASRDTAAAARLWEMSEKLTGVRYLSAD